MGKYRTKLNKIIIDIFSWAVSTFICEVPIENFNCDFKISI